MKIKIKLTIEQYRFLVRLIENTVFDNVTPMSPIPFAMDKMQLFNARCFLALAYKRVIDLASQFPTITPVKERTFSFDVNQLSVVLYILDQLDHLKKLDAYYISIHQLLIAQSKNLPTIKY